VCVAVNADHVRSLNADDTQCFMNNNIYGLHTHTYSNTRVMM